MNPLISVIIPTLNRGEALARTIATIIEQIYDREQYELIVVDNGSSDSTREIVRHFVDKEGHPSIRYFYEPEPGLLSGRHRGAFEAKGSLLTFTDDDVDWSPGFLEAVAAAFEDSNVILVGGRNLPLYEIPPPVWFDRFWDTTPQGRLCGYLSLLDFGDKPVEIDPTLVWGLNYSIRKKSFLELGGFNPELLPDHLAGLQGDGETGLSMKAREAGFKALYSPGATVYHRVPARRLTVAYLERRGFFEGLACSYGQLRSDRDQGRFGVKIPVGVLKLVLAIHRRQQLYEAILSVFAGSMALFFCRCAGFSRERLAARYVRLAFSRGYRFHRTAALKSRELRKWITRENYLDYRLPDHRAIGADLRTPIELGR